jgi:peptidyl-prolyl cis-trans isomerase C
MRIFLIFAYALLLSCEPEIWKDKSAAIAEVEDSRLSVNELKEARLERDSISKEEWTSRIEFWVNSEVMYKEAIKRGLQKDPVVKKLLKDAERKILIDRLRLTIDYSADMEYEKETLDYYETNKDQFRINADSLADSLALFIPFFFFFFYIRSIIISEKKLAKEEEWLSEIKNNYSIEVYPHFLDSL